MAEDQRNQTRHPDTGGGHQPDDDARGRQGKEGQGGRRHPGADEDEHDPSEGRDRAPSDSNRSKDTPWLGGG